MEPLLMMKTACVLLAIAALGGLAMAGIRLAGTPRPPAWLAMLHGFLAGAAKSSALESVKSTVSDLKKEAEKRAAAK